MTEIQTEEPTPRDRAEQFLVVRAAALAKSKGPMRMMTKAADALAALAKADPDAWEAWSEEVLLEVAADRLRQELARVRHAAVRAEVLGARRGRLAAFASDAIAARLAGELPPSPFDARYALPGADRWLRLAEMRRPDLLAVARHRASLSRTNGVEAIFLSTLAARLPDDETTVAAAMTEDDVTSIHTKALTSNLGALDKKGPPKT